jgi:peptide/nickel transport system permease protein
LQGFKYASVFSKAKGILKSEELLVGLVLILFFTITSFLGHYFIPQNSLTLHLNNEFHAPNWAHPFGTDYLGRDVFARTLEGGAISIEVGVSAGLLTVFVGGVVGVFSGYVGGKIDIGVQRVVDVVLSVPLIVLVLVLLTIFGTTIQLIVISIAVLSWPTLGRITRAETLSLKQRDFIQAEIVAGASHAHIMFRHLLPNELKTIIVYSGLSMSIAVLIQAALAYLGFTAGTVSWGFDLFEAQSYIFSGSWWMIVFPGIAITLTSLGFYLISEGLRRGWK